MGFFFGLIIMTMMVSVFQVNDFDFNNMEAGVRTLVSGVNPYAPETRVNEFFNPPFSVIFLWPILFITPKIAVAVGGALLFAVVFYQRSWVGLAWFLTNSALYIFAKGGIDMYVIGAGLLLLFAGDKVSNRWVQFLLRVLAYGFLMVKPQGGLFVVILYILYRRDWWGLFASMLVFGLPFQVYYLDWLHLIVAAPPASQTIGAHTIMGKFGPWLAIIVAIWIIFARKWNFWELGGALAGILSPYGMPGVPVFLTLTSVRQIVAIPIVVLFSAGLAKLTWVTPPPGVDFYEYLTSFLVIYHLGILALVLILSSYPGVTVAPNEGAQIDARALLAAAIARLRGTT